jgi:hypothetical protein
MDKKDNGYGAPTITIVEPLSSETARYNMGLIYVECTPVTSSTQPALGAYASHCPPATALGKPPLPVSPLTKVLSGPNIGNYAAWIPHPSTNFRVHFRVDFRTGGMPPIDTRYALSAEIDPP